MPNLNNLGRSVGYYGPRGGTAVDDLEQARNRIFESIQELQGFFDRDPQAQGLRGFFDQGATGTFSTQLMDQLRGRAAGSDAPFTNNVLTSFLGQNSDASAGALASENDLIRRSFANAGLSGSGLESSARISAQRAASASTRRGRRDITSRAELENFQARERAQAQVQGFLAQQLAAKQAEVAMRYQAAQQAQSQEQSALSRLQKVTQGGATQGVPGGNYIPWRDTPGVGHPGGTPKVSSFNPISTIISNPIGTSGGSPRSTRAPYTLGAGSGGAAAHVGGQGTPFATAPNVVNRGPLPGVQQPGPQQPAAPSAPFSGTMNLGGAGGAVTAGLISAAGADALRQAQEEQARQLAALQGLF